MIDSAIIEQARQLLVEGQWSRRKIAKKLGISRSTVNQLANGKRPDYEEMSRRRELAIDLEPRGPFVRCPGCGGRVQLPCLLCEIRQQKVAE
jgi:DNA-binding XRE family transcriptional regulator